MIAPLAMWLYALVAVLTLGVYWWITRRDTSETMPELADGSESQSFICEHCKVQPGTNICAKCKEVGLIHSSVGRYCSRDCQVAAHVHHKHVHKVVTSARNDYNNRGAPQTIVLALLEAHILNKLPPLQDNVLSILIVGARAWVEGDFAYDAIYTFVRQLNIYPELNRVDITLVGPEVNNTRTQQFPAGHYSLTMKNGKLESVFPKLSSSDFSVAVVPQPGFSDYLQSWTSAMRVLVKSNILTITTGYSNSTRWTMDGVFDEVNLIDYFGANLVLPKTHNAAIAEVLFAASSHGAGPFAFYIIFQGFSTIKKLSYKEAIRRNQILFLSWLADESTNHENNPDMGFVCAEFAEGLKNDSIQLKDNISHKQLEGAMQQRAYERMSQHDR